MVMINKFKKTKIEFVWLRRVITLLIFILLTYLLYTGEIVISSPIEMLESSIIIAYSSTVLIIHFVSLLLK